MAQLVELYATMRAYEEVAKTCMLRGFADMAKKRRLEFMDSLSRYTTRYYGRAHCKSQARAHVMDEVLTRYNQLSIWRDA